MTSEFMLAAPEIWMLSMASFLLVLDLYLGRWARWTTYLLCQITLIGAILLTLNVFGQVETLFYGAFVVDNIGNFLKLVIYAIGIFVLIYSRYYLFERQIDRNEYFVLILYSILGMMVLVSARSLLTLYLGVELLVLPIYALITITKEESAAPEAAMKYFVMGAMASGMLLYGISLLYGVTGSFEILEVANALALQPKDPQVALLFGFVFILVGLGFKLGAAPFHMWVPDVYQGAPTSVTLLISTLPKVAAFGMAIRLLVDTFPTFNVHWEQLLVVMAVLSLAIGNLAAIAQSNLKRLLAYSTIGHIGFLVLGLLAGPESGYASALLYIVIYALMSLAAFGIMIGLSYQGYEAENIQDFRGLGTRQPWVAFLMMLVLFSLAGVPPLAGFYAKFLVLNALINAGYIWLSVVAVIFTVIGAYYYLRVIRVMFFDAPLENVSFQKVPNYGVVLLSVNSLMILALGIYPAPLWNVCSLVLAAPK